MLTSPIIVPRAVIVYPMNDLTFANDRTSVFFSNDRHLHVSFNDMLIINNHQ